MSRTGTVSPLEFELMGDQAKLKEVALRAITDVSHEDNFVVRVDGRAFHTFTRRAVKPFDGDFSNAMISAAGEVVKSLKCQAAYVQSDEISYMFKGAADRGTEGYQHPFNGRVCKLISVIASLTSVAFYKAISETALGESQSLPHFDGRLAEIGDAEAIRTNVGWREQDARRNAVSMIAQSVFSQKELQGVSTIRQLGLLDAAGVTYESFEERYRSGTYIYTGREERELSEDEREKIPEHNRPSPGTLYTRTVNRYTHSIKDWDKIWN